MTYELPLLNYSADSLAPFISMETIEYHHGKHHAAYVNNLNNLVKGSPYEGSDLETLVMKADGPIFNNAAQVWNHTFYFNSFSPSGPRVPSGEMARLIDYTFGSFDKFKEEFTRAGATLFGSGWAWLSMDHDRLLITQEQNAGNPIRSGKKPLLTCDVWEHAYYIDYRNRRPDYIKAFWDMVDWDIIGSRI